MTTSTLRISLLKELIALEEERAKVNDKIVALQDKLQSNTDVTPRAARSNGKGGRAPALRKKGERKGSLRDQILAATHAAGEKGITIQELATLLEKKSANIHSWFSANARKLKELKKIGEARYAHTDALGSKTKTPAAPRKARGKKAGAKAAPLADRPAKRGELKSAILAELRKAGEAGVTIKELSGRTGSRYKNLYIWFVTTGKRIEGLEKVGPARYRLNEAA